MNMVTNCVAFDRANSRKNSKSQQMKLYEIDANHKRFNYCTVQYKNSFLCYLKW